MQDLNQVVLILKSCCFLDFIALYYLLERPGVGMQRFIIKAESLTNKMSVIGELKMNWLEKKRITLRIIFRNCTLNLWFSSSPIKSLFSTKSWRVSYFLNLHSATLYSSCRDSNGHFWLGEMPGSLWFDLGSPLLPGEAPKFLRNSQAELSYGDILACFTT